MTDPMTDLCSSPDIYWSYPWICRNPTVDPTNAHMYETKGYAVYRNFVSKDTVDLLNAEMDLLAQTLPVSEEVFDEDRTGKIKQIQYLHQKSTLCAELLEQLKPLGESIIGHNRFSVLNMQLFEKHPGISKPTRAHQDNAYFKLSPATAVTLWISLDTIDEDNGCLYYAPGSHLRPTHKHSRYHSDTTFRVRSGVMGLSLCLHEHPEETDVAVHTSPGDVAVHNCNTIHRAGKNGTKDKRRRAIGIVFIPDECGTDARLEKYHQDRLKADIELQKIKNPGLYRDLTSSTP